MKLWFSTVSEFIALYPVFYTVRNIAVLLALIWLGRWYLRSSHAAWLYRYFPWLQGFSIQQSVQAYRKRGEYAQAGELLLANQSYEAAAQLFLEGQLFGRAADVYLQRGQKEKAANLYEKAGLHEKAAQLFIEKKDFDRAEKNLNQAGQGDKIAALYEKMGAKQMAANVYLKSQRYRDAIALYVAEGDFRKAAQVLKQLYDQPAADFNPSCGYKNRQEVAKSAGALFLKANQPDEAAKLFLAEKLLKDAATAYVAAKDYEHAIDCFIKAEDFLAAAKILKDLGRAPEAALHEAEAYLREGQEEPAAQAFIKAGEYAKAGDIYRNMQAYDKAGEMYEKAREYGLAGSMYRDAEEFERAGQAFEKAKQYDAAIELYGLAQNHARQVALFEKLQRYYEAALNYYERQLFAEAMIILSKINSDDVDYRKACGLQGKILLQQGHLQDAKVKLEEAVSSIKEIRPDNIGTLFDLAKVSEKVGGGSPSLSSIEKLLAKDFVNKQVSGSVKIQDFEAMKRQLSGLVTQVVSRPPTVNATAPLPVTPSVQRYVPIKEIGKGGMGIVYTAQDTVLDRTVALKVLPASLKKNPQAVATFTREAKNAASLNHKNIVTVYDAGIQDSDYYIAMELVEGKTIKELIKKNKRLTLKSLYAVLKQVLEGMQYAHQRKMVHRDLTTNNIMWNHENMVKIMDFGLAKVIRELQSEQSIIGGTPSYMSPEQTLGNPIDHRTDIYTLGVCLFEMATGELPFTKGDLGYHHVHTTPPDPSSIVPQLPDALVSLILKCMQKDPNARLQSMAAVGEWLKAETEFQQA